MGEAGAHHTWGRVRAAGDPIQVYWALGSPGGVWSIWHNDRRLEFFRETTGQENYPRAQVEPTGIRDSDARYEWWCTGPEQEARHYAFLQWLKDKYAPMKAVPNEQVGGRDGATGS